MVHKISVRWAEYMVANGADENQKEVYAYGLECLLNEAISDILLMAAAVMLGRVWQMICWIVLFNIFRVHFGGFHAKTPWGCLIGSTLAGVLCVILYPVFYVRYIVLIAILCMDNGIVWRIAPVLHYKHPFSEERRVKVRKRARLLAGLLSLVLLILYHYEYEMTALLCATFTCSCVLSLAGKVLN